MQEEDRRHGRLKPGRGGVRTGSVAAAEPLAAQTKAGEVVLKDNAAILLIHHQDLTVGWIASQPQKMVVADVRMLARWGSEMGIPLLVTLTTKDNIASNIKDIREPVPAAYAVLVKRGGTPDCFLAPAFAKAVKGFGRKPLIMTRLTTDICLCHWAWGPRCGLSGEGGGRCLRVDVDLGR